jgi:hypothetical protein
MKHRIAIIAVFFLAPTLFAYTNTNMTETDWNKGEIRAQAFYDARFDESGVPVDFASLKLSPARERAAAYAKAREEAVEQIVAELREIQIEPGVFVKDLIESDATFARRFGDLLDERIRSRESPAGYCAARSEARISIYSLIRALPYEYPDEPLPKADKNPLPTEYTSLIIDTRAERTTPMIFPSVYDEDGLEIYGRRFVHIEKGYSQGLVSYCYSENAAKSHPKAGDHPYYTTAIRSIKNLPVVAHRDSRRILAHKKTVENLKQCRVIFIIDKPETGKPR